MHIETLYHQATSTFTHIVVDKQTRRSAIIDSVLDYDQFAGKVSTESADEVIAYLHNNNLINDWILETHVHADHITAAHYLQEQVGGKIAIGSNIKKVLEMWVPVFEIEHDTPLSGEQYDLLFEEGDSFAIGNLPVTVWHTPGHTPACATYLIEDAIFVGDTMFAPHLGTARCDFPGGSATELYHSIQRFYQLPDDTRVFLAHDYPEEGDEPLSMISIAQAKSTNAQLRPDTPLEEYVAKREARDATLAVPRLLLPSIQANLRNGQFGDVSKSGKQFVKIPVNVL
ncbi:MBL fold metallo-hydrolase [Neptunicella marina]|uniref:MBL fold metallo-hydrolase n=2 Tax=Neptunicella marina TaxID=2125989 RepID=A0A8J6IXI7_9ALTE|nr:MBL fold metallo-hydrolase [Neptunicella marina]